jgi:hypothetical protein
VLILGADAGDDALEPIAEAIDRIGVSSTGKVDHRAPQRPYVTGDFARRLEAGIINHPEPWENDK